GAGAGEAGSEGPDDGYSKEKRGWRDLSLRLPLFQLVLASESRDDRNPPILEVDVASIRYVQGHLHIRHVCVTSWPRTRCPASSAPNVSGQGLGAQEADAWGGETPPGGVRCFSNNGGL
ncbi:unnamed protein product, partial [Discosporangium mesarthrocarpum]